MTTSVTASGPVARPHRPPSDTWFFVAIGAIGAFYVLMILALLVADAAYMIDTPLAAPSLDPAFAQRHPWLAGLLDNHLTAALAKPENPLRDPAEPDLLFADGHPVAVGGRARGIPVGAVSISRAYARGFDVGHSDRIAAAGHLARRHRCA